MVSSNWRGCPTRVLFCSDNRVFFHAKSSHVSTNDNFHAVANQISALPKTVTKGKWSNNMQIDIFVLFI